jgi:hypothetical protein
MPAPSYARIIDALGMAIVVPQTGELLRQRIIMAQSLDCRRYAQLGADLWDGEPDDGIPLTH